MRDTHVTTTYVPQDLKRKNQQNIYGYIQWRKPVERRVIYRAFHNVLRDYKHYNKKTKGPTLM